MKASRIEDRLALLGALIVLVGVSFAADNAFAEEITDVTSTAVAIHNAANETLDDAKQASAEAAASAAESLAMENWLDLDIKLEDHRSTLLAGKK